MWNSCRWTSRVDGYPAIAQARWLAWRRTQRLDDRLPDSIADVLDDVIAFTDPAVLATVDGLSLRADDSGRGPDMTTHRNGTTANLGGVA